MKMAKQRENKSWHPSTVWLAIFLIAISGMYIFSLYKINEKCEKQYNFNKEIKSQSNQIKNPLIELKPDTANKKFYINENDISQLNNHIEYLTNKLETEIDRNQKNSEFNIERLNLFLALGISFLALIGGLLPLAVNFISKHDIEARLKDIEKRGKESEEIVKEAEKKMPTVDLLILQSSVAKFASTETLRLLSGDNQYADIANIIQRVISALKLFGDSDYVHYTADNIAYLNEIITELRLGLKYGSLRKSPSTTRVLHKQLDEIVTYLDSNEDKKINEFPTIIKQLVTKLTAVKKSFSDLIPKTS